MRQLVELREREDQLAVRGQPLRVVAVVTVDKEGTGGSDVPARSGWRGTVLLDADQAVRDAFGATPGSVVLVDRRLRVRWRKPGTAYKRPRADLVAHAVRAVLEREADPGALQAAREDLASTSARARAEALEALARLEAVEARALMEALLAGDPSSEVREAAARALAALRDPATLPALAAVVADVDAPRELRRTAAQALLGFGDDFQGWPGAEFRPDYVHAESRDLAAARAAVLPAAQALLAERRDELRRLGARLLGRLRHVDARARLLELCDDRDAQVREAALAGLAEWREAPEVLAAARGLAEDRAPGVRRMARYVIEGPAGKVRE